MVWTGLRRRIDEHLVPWSIVWAELDLDPLAELNQRVEKLPPVPTFPEVELDFSVLVDVTRAYAQVAPYIARFDDALLRRVTFVDAYEGESLPPGKRALTFRARIGDAQRTLTDADLVRFRRAFQKHLEDGSMELRTE